MNKETKALSADELLSQLNVSARTGLSEEDARQRIEQYGLNEIPERKVNPLLKFLGYFWGPIPWMIETAIILSAIVQKWEDFWIILVLLFMNAIVGFWEEYQAENAIAALKETLALNARIFRNGKWNNIPAKELVPGDIVRLRLGDIVPADVKIMSGDSVEVDQSALTGESLPVEREVNQDLYSGSIIRQGEVEGIVFGTGLNTFFGKTVVMVAETVTVSHFQKAILKIGNYLIAIALALVSLIILVALFRHEDFIMTLTFALVLTIAAIPVAMPAVLSVTMAIGANLLAKKKAIVQRLSSIEEMACIDVLCSDKTGTLTQNKLTLGNPVTLAPVDVDALILYASLASRMENGDMIDMAIMGAMKEPDTISKYQIQHFKPFDPVSKRTEVQVIGPDGQSFSVSKGAPQVIYALISENEALKQKIEETVNAFASKGNRSLGVAKTDAKGNWEYIGILPLYDPPRVDSRAIIEETQSMGVDVKMVTGDQLAIAKEIAKQIHLGTNILVANVIDESKHFESDRIAEMIENSDGFAQVFPEHKYFLVEALQKNGHIVGMTGDGVNDAPALKKADSGIAVSGATDAARAAADIVLLSPGLDTITEAIIESRKIFQRMSSYAIYRIAETIRVLLFMTLSILIFQFYPVTAVMIVLLALLNDGAILSIAYDNATAAKEPESWKMNQVLFVATVLGIIGVVASFGLFFIGEEVFHLDRNFIQTLIYLKLSVAGHFTIFLTRTREHFWQSRPSNILLSAVICTQVLATLLAVFGIFMNPIPWYWAAFVWGYAFCWFIVNDFVKVATYRALKES